MNEHNTRLLIYSIPLIIGILITVLNSNAVNSFTEAIEVRIRRWQINNLYRSGIISKWVLRPILYLVVAFHNWTDGLKNRGFKNGLRVTISSYFVTIALILAFWIAVYIIACILIFYVTLFIISYARERERSGGNEFNFGKQLFSKGGSSRRRRQLVGDDFIEYYDSNGRVVGRSEMERSFLGKEFIQYYDGNGRKVGTSELKQRFTGGKYTQYYDEQENKVGISEHKESLLGEKYIQHHDEDGQKTGRSVDRENLFGEKRRDFE